MSECDHAATDNKVIDSRPAEFAGCPAIRRRRKCLSCGFRWSTLEISCDALDELCSAGERLIYADLTLAKISALASNGGPSPKTAE